MTEISYIYCPHEHLNKPCVACANKRLTEYTELLGVEGVMGISLVYCKRVNSSTFWVPTDACSKKIKKDTSFLSMFS